MGRMNFSDVLSLNVPTVCATDSSSKVASTAFVQAVVPAGVVFPYAGSVAPVNFLMCDGSLVSRTTYAALFAAIGTTYGAGDGSTTFKLPDLRGQFIRGLDQGAGVDAGRTLGSSQADGFASHNHGVNDGGHNHGGGINNGIGVTPSAGSGVASSTPSTTQNAVTNISIQATGGSETRPKNVALNHIIKAF